MMMMGSSEQDASGFRTRTISVDTAGWIGWMETVPEYKLSPKTAFADIIVPTLDSIRYMNVLERMVTHNFHVLCVGPTGTGKTLSVADKHLAASLKDVCVGFIVTHFKEVHNTDGFKQLSRTLLELGAYEQCARLPSNPCGRGGDGFPIDLARGGGHHGTEQVRVPGEAVAGRSGHKDYNLNRFFC